MFTIFDTLNTATTYIASAYIYFMAIAIALLFVKDYLDRTTVSDEHYQQTKDLFADKEVPVPAEDRVSVEVAIAPSKRTTRGTPAGGVPASSPIPETPQGKVLVLTVEKTEDDWLTVDFGKMSIRAIRQYVRDNNLQDLIKECTGLTVSRCTLAQLQSVLTESQECDRVYSRIIQSA